jgi:hypothetical protein
MNTNHINNKNTKRIAIAAGATAAVLFLSAGFVASRGGESNNSDKADAPLAIVPAPIFEEVSDVIEQLVAEAPVAEKTDTASSTTKTTKTSKSKKSPTQTGGVVYGDNAATEATPTPDTTVATAPAVAEASGVSVPTDQPAVEQPAPAAPAEQTTATSSAPTSQSGTTSISVPKLTMSDSVMSSLKGIDLTKSTLNTSLPTLCIPGVTC